MKESIYIMIVSLFLFGWMSPSTAAEVNGSVPMGYPSTQEKTPPMANKRVFYITTVHIDGKTNIKGDKDHPPEPLPTSPLPPGGGFSVTNPDSEGNWMIRSFAFLPSLLVVYQGDEVILNFLAVQGTSHAISVEGYIDTFVLKRGELKTVSFTAKQVGTIDFVCSNHQPSMRGQILVLPR